MKLTNKRIMEIIKEETERFITEEEEEVYELIQQLDELAEAVDGQFDMLRKSIVKAAELSPENSEKYVRILSVHRAYVDTLKELADILR